MEAMTLGIQVSINSSWAGLNSESRKENRVRATGENRDVYEFNNLLNEEPGIINISVDLSACLCVWS